MLSLYWKTYPNIAHFLSKCETKLLTLHTKIVSKSCEFCANNVYFKIPCSLSKTANFVSKNW